MKIPGATDLAWAREILQELRRRSGEMNRPQAERDYLDRLLKALWTLNERDSVQLT